MIMRKVQIICLVFFIVVFIVVILINKSNNIFIKSIDLLQNKNQVNKIEYPKYGHSKDFSWVSGKLERYVLEGGCWVLLFEEDRGSNQNKTEEYFGILALKVPINLINKLQDKKFVVVQGRVVGQKFSMACPPNIYEVSSLISN